MAQNTSDRLDAPWNFAYLNEQNAATRKKIKIRIIHWTV